MSEKKFTPNRTYKMPEKAEMEWAIQIGQLMMNWGLIEFLAVSWLRHLANDPVLVDVGIEAQQSRRVDILIRLLNASTIDPTKKARAIELWRETKGLAKLRNQIAHNAMIFQEKDDGSIVGGIFSMKDFVGPPPWKSELLNLQDISRASKRLIAVGTELSHILT